MKIVMAIVFLLLLSSIVSAGIVCEGQYSSGFRTVTLSNGAWGERAYIAGRGFVTVDGGYYLSGTDCTLYQLDGDYDSRLYPAGKKWRWEFPDGTVLSVTKR